MLFSELASININPGEIQLLTGPLEPILSHGKKSYKELHLVNLFLAVNSDIIFLPSHLNLLERKSCSHVRKENNVVDKRKKILIGEYNKKAQAKSRINPANTSKQSQCKTVVMGSWGRSSRHKLHFVKFYKAPVVHSHFCHEKSMVTKPRFFSPSCFLNYYSLNA